MDRLPIRGGVSLHPMYYEEILEGQPDIGWFAVHAEDYLGLGGPAHHYLERIAARYPLSIQCSSLSIGSAESVNSKHLQDIHSLIQRYTPSHMSLSLSWCRWQGAYFVENLPLPYSDEALDQVTMNIRSVQNTLGRRVMIENPARLFALDGNAYSEGAFLAELVRNTGCGIVLDLSNLYVSCQNTGADPYKELNEYPLAAVKEVHISGHSLRPLDTNNMLLIADQHPHITKPVWQLLRDTLSRLPGAVPTLVEWDRQNSDWTLLLTQMRKVDEMIQDWERTPLGATV
jgi:uncharacterized protein